MMVSPVRNTGVRNPVTGNWQNSPPKGRAGSADKRQDKRSSAGDSGEEKRIKREA